MERSLDRIPAASELRQKEHLRSPKMTNYKSGSYKLYAIPRGHTLDGWPLITWLEVHTSETWTRGTTTPTHTITRTVVVFQTNCALANRTALVEG